MVSKRFDQQKFALLVSHYAPPAKAWAAVIVAFATVAAFAPEARSPVAAAVAPTQSVHAQATAWAASVKSPVVSGVDLAQPDPATLAHQALDPSGVGSNTLSANYAQQVAATGPTQGGDQSTARMALLIGR